MIALWMLYACVIGIVVMIAAIAAERVAHLLGRPRRWGYAAAVALVVILPLLGAWRTTRIASGGESLPKRAAVDPFGNGSDWLAQTVADKLERIATSAALPSLSTFERPLLVLWVGISLVLAIGYGAGVRRLALRRRRWNESIVAGERVLVAANAGPAVVGALHPRIVLPEWALALDADRLALVIAHEREHIRARDPFLAHVASVAVFLAPWNPAAWWALRRLRLALEVDCDARVLATACTHRVATPLPRLYGDLLLTVAEHHVEPLPAIAPALLERTSSLSRRILAMQPTRVRRPALQVALATTAAALLVIVACEAPPPSAIVPDGKDHAASRLLGKTNVELLGKDSVSSLVARYFPEMRQGVGKPSLLFIVRDAKGTVLRATRADAPEQMKEIVSDARPLNADRVRTMETTPMKIADERKMSGPDALKGITPDRIATVDVSKHAAGVFGPDAVSVILVTLKS